MTFSPEALSFRQASSADAESLAPLVNSAYRGESSKAGWTTEADLLDGSRTSPDLIRQILATPGEAILMLMQEDLPIGCVHLRKKPDCATLGMLTIKPTLQASGLGRRMLEFAEQWVLNSWQLDKIEMRVIHKPRLHTGSATFLHHCLVGSPPVKALHGPVVDLKLHLPQRLPVKV